MSVVSRPLVALILAAACWGAGTVLSKQAVAEVPPLALLPAQLAVSVGFLAVIAFRRRVRPPRTREARRLGRLGILNPGLAYALSLVGLSQVTASLSVLLWAAEPVLILVLAVLLLRERPGAAVVGLSAIAIAGLGLVLWDPAASGAVPGIVLTLAGVGCCAIYSVATRRWLSGEDSTLDVLLAQQAHALGFAILLAVAAAIAGVAIVPATLTVAGVASTVASGLVYYGLAYWCYLYALRFVPASVAAASFYLIPVFGVAAATVIGDRLTPIQLAGAVVIILAVAGISLTHSRRIVPSAAPASAT